MNPCQKTVGNGGSNPEKVGVIGTINKWGSQLDTDTADTNQILWPVKKSVQDYIFLDAAVTARLKSTTINDATGGTGALTVKVIYQNSAGIEVEETINPNGTVGTLLNATTLGCFRMSIETSGSGNTNDGDIQLVNESGGDILAIIKAGEGQTQIAVQRIPNNRIGVVTYHKVDFARILGNNNSVMRLKVRKSDGTIIIKWDPTLTSVNTKDEKEYKSGGIDLAPGDWIFWQAISVSASDTPLRGSFDIDLKAAP